MAAAELSSNKSANLANVVGGKSSINKRPFSKIEMVLLNTMAAVYEEAALGAFAPFV